MNLTLAIPARDDAEGLVRLLDRAARLGCASHAVVVDDGSAAPLDADRLTASYADPVALMREWRRGT